MTLHSTSASASLMKVAKWDGESQDIDRVLTAAFDADDYLECIKDLWARGIDPQSYINELDRIIEGLPVDSGLQKRCIRALRKTCGLYGILPSSYVVPLKLSGPSGRQRPFASGGFSDVWKLTDETNRELAFAVKSLRVYEGDPMEKIQKRYCKEVITCKRTNHPNVLSIEGVAPGLFDLCMVSQWMPDGNLRDYTNKHPEANRLELLIGVARGLDYLHDNEIIHGDLKSGNILIDTKGNPRLSDFAFSSITKNLDSVNASTPNHGHTLRYCAPELLDAGRIEKRKPTRKSDVYSFSMVIVELVTGTIPFAGTSDPIVTIMVSKGKRPQKPLRFEAPGITPMVWKIAEKCWHQKAKRRPEAKEVLQSLETLASSDGKPTSLFERLRQVFRD